MTISTLDAETALLVIDLQKGLMGLPMVHPVGDVVANAARLAESFRRHHLPVVLINVAGAPSGRTEHPSGLGALPDDWTAFVPELRQQASDHVVTKRTRGAFTNTDLAAYLAKHGVTQVVLAGVATGAGVESTARHAHELGYNVTLAVDAMTDRDADVHHNSVTRIFPRLGETGTTRQILDLIDNRS